MDTCMMREEVMDALQTAGFRGRVIHTGDAGLQPAYAAAIAERVDGLLRETYQAEPDARVAVLLTQHGMDVDATNPCGPGPDRYVANARRMFHAALEATGERLMREGTAPPVLVVQAFAHGAGEGTDPQDLVATPLEAFAKAREAGATHVVDLPIDFWADGYDTLNALREAWGFTPAEAPYFDADHETRFVRDGVAVRIASASFGHQAKAAALVGTVLAALAEDDGAGASGRHGHP